MNAIKKYAPWFLLGVLLLISKEIIAKYEYIFDALKAFKVIIMPFLMGIIIAYITNASINHIQKKFNKGRTFAFVMTYLILIGTIITFFVLVVPSLVKNVIDLSKGIPVFTKEIVEIIDNVILKIQNSNIDFFMEYTNNNMAKITEFVMGIIEKGLNSVVSSFISLTSAITNFVISIIVSMYVSYDIKSFEKKIYNFVRALIGTNKAEKIYEFLVSSSKVFKNFFIGQMLDALIVASLCFIGLSFLRVPYATFLSLIAAVFNMIPYIGPILGGVPIVVIAFLDSPQKAIWSILFILILQQIEGNIIAPKILGDAVGISSFSILLAITLGGAYFGIFGMFLAVPVFKIILMIIESFVNKKIEMEEKV